MTHWALIEQILRDGFIGIPITSLNAWARYTCKRLSVSDAADKCKGSSSAPRTNGGDYSHFMLCLLYSNRTEVLPALRTESTHDFLLHDARYLGIAHAVNFADHAGRSPRQALWAAPWFLSVRSASGRSSSTFK